MTYKDTDIDARFLYYRDNTHRPMITLCRIHTCLGAIAYGWAITSPLDNPRYATGRFLAYGRAVAALIRGANIGDKIWKYARPVVREEARETIWNCEAWSFRHLVDEDSTDELPQSMQPAKGMDHSG